MMTRSHRSTLTSALCVAAASGCALGARPGDQEFIVIKAARVITVSGEEIERGEVVIVDGKVSLVGVGLEYPKSAEVIEARDQVVMPGLIDCHSRWGLPFAIRSGINGSATVDAELYLDGIDFEPMLRQGFIAAAMYPDGSGVQGKATVYRTAGDADDRVLKRDAYVLIDLTSQPQGRNTLRDAIARAKKEIEKVEKARAEWEQKKKEAEEKAKQEAEAKKAEDEKAKEPPKPEGEPPPQPPPPSAQDGATPDAAEPETPPEGQPPAEEKKDEVGEFVPPPIDDAVKPIVALLKGEAGTPALIEVSRAGDVLHLDQVLENIDAFEYRLLITHPTGSDFGYVVETLGDRGAFVAVSPALGTVPQTSRLINIPAELQRAGCSIAFMPAADNEGSLENVLQGAAELVRAGFDRAEALKSLTLRPAELVGLGASHGTIEEGREADLIFLSADPFAAATRVERVMIGGEIVWDRGGDDR